ncbi:hypothetical protein DFH08DRAFT_934656 [Mycena albidolilacea]|uniref:BTB domain-containing protein n=1 Tax=Mycena albidolilacea TaxID=1033008 RepID=A0AAD7A9J8_9AGAR|nr:hypothetical protein DFH08DRAFT_934656 [Mycena albidolilacea]
MISSELNTPEPIASQGIPTWKTETWPWRTVTTVPDPRVPGSHLTATHELRAFIPVVLTRMAPASVDENPAYAEIATVAQTVLTHFVESAIAQATLPLVVVMLAQCGGQHQVEELLVAKFSPGVPGRDIWVTTTIEFFTNNTLEIVLNDLGRGVIGDRGVPIGAHQKSHMIVTLRVFFRHDMSAVSTRSSTKARQSTATLDSKDSLPTEDSAKCTFENTEEPAESASSKRPKTASQGFAKHSRFWALDGNVILQVGSVAFKVHRSRLSTQSVWFEKLFEKKAGREEPLEDDEENINDVAVETLDGLDLYLLDPLATMEDFEALLTAIFRAATTFKFHKFRQYTSRYLLEWFSDDVDELSSSVLPQPAAAVLLGRTWNLPGILKRAFYELLRTKPDEPPTRDDETVNMSNRLEGWEMVDITRLGEAQKHLTAAWLSVLTTANSDTVEANRKLDSSHCRGRAQISARSNLRPRCPNGGELGIDPRLQGLWYQQKSSFAKKKVQIWEDMDVWLAIPVEDEEEEKGGDD